MTSSEDLMALHRFAIGSAAQDESALRDTVRDQGTLDYIADKASYIGDRIDRAAWLMWSIANYHPFAEGNKRTAYLAAQSVLEGKAIGCTDIRASDTFIRDMAAGIRTEGEVKRFIEDNLTGCDGDAVAFTLETQKELLRRLSERGPGPAVSVPRTDL